VEPTLFDNTQRTNDSPAAMSEPKWAFLNRTARPEFAAVRDLLEQWFDRYPIDSRDELGSAFRSSNDRQHLGAFFELYLHELLRSLGCDVSLHPRVPGASSSPDFLVTAPDCSKFVVEAAVCFGADTKADATRARQNAALDALNALSLPDYFLSVDIHSVGAQPVSGRRLRRAVQDFIDTLDYDAVRALGTARPLPSFAFVEAGWRIELSAAPKTPESRGKAMRAVGMSGSEAQWIAPEQFLRATIVKKAGRYGRVLDLPYVIAINTMDEFSTNFDDEMEALFGDEVVTFTTGDVSTARPSRRRNGAWTSKSKPRFTRNSAVLIVQSLVPWTVGRARAMLYHHPWARRPYTSVLTELPQAVPIDGSMDLRDGRQPWTFFGIPDDWPFA
jgi:hypothetical protein